MFCPKSKVWKPAVILFTHARVLKFYLFVFCLSSLGTYLWNRCFLKGSSDERMTCWKFSIQQTYFCCLNKLQWLDFLRNQQSNSIIITTVHALYLGQSNCIKTLLDELQLRWVNAITISIYSNWLEYVRESLRWYQLRTRCSGGW